MSKAQRIRYPLHNLIEFGDNVFDQTLWRIIQTPEFQRLRRVKQLGFSEIVYPGATHSRFSHSLGAYHIAKNLLHIIKKRIGDAYVDIRGQHALAAALIHDIGHGPFSHAFEEVGKTLGLKMAKHEDVSDAIIRGETISKILDEAFDSGFSTNVANLIKSPGPSSKIYGAVVSSQFDADRLDYMQRDRLMTGTQLGGIDFTWLLSNLEIGEVPWGDEEQQIGTQQTFILGPKAIHAAESYILGLFQLYPTVYYHKATRGVEKLFTQLLITLFTLVKNDDYSKTNLPASHPLIKFAQQPESLERALLLDDSIVIGALPQMAEAEHPLIKNFASRIRERNLYKCIDVREPLKNVYSANEELTLALAKIRSELSNWSQEKSQQIPRLLHDEGVREPYKRIQEDKGPLNQIMIRESSGEIVDISSHSNIINAIQPFAFYRVYVANEDDEARRVVEQAIKGVMP